ncbi:uncharacterized protein LOC131664297 [Phymastichus coffea]|uniref:uncharacterized protein LOC131664297 n=1 Tax=Phymastichus coffea TaxID=108790 RepID=UPI00273C50BD|nr:uncharacterized protein LOC131664297 [Phymastichus coffea]
MTVDCRYCANSNMESVICASLLRNTSGTLMRTIKAKGADGCKKNEKKTTRETEPKKKKKYDERSQRMAFKSLMTYYNKLSVEKLFHSTSRLSTKFARVLKISDRFFGCLFQVTVSVLLVATTATLTPGYVKQPDNDKNSSSYHYNYKIENDSGDVQQSKTEARNGEHATGRYYVNSKQASTDVKYYADDWGYHPLVKYSLSDDHSSSSASLAFGAVQTYDSDNGTPSLTYLTPSRERKKLAQVTVPYQQDIVYSGNISNTDHQSSSSSSGSVSAQQSESTNLVDMNYVTNAPTQSIYETIFSPTSDAFSSTTKQAKYYQQQFDHLTSQENDLSSSLASEENQLIVENTGGFGARVRADTSYSSSTASSIHSSGISTGDSLPSVTRDGRYYHGRFQQKNKQPIPTNYLPSVLPGLNYFTSTILPPLDNGVTANSIESNVANLKSSSNKYEFSKPIVVAEPSQPHKEPPFQYSTTFECEDDKSPTTPNPLQYKDDTASSRILNSIQAGVALVNAGEVHLIGRTEDARSPAPVEEKIDDFDQPAQLTQHHDVTLLTQTQTQASRYMGINPAFGGQQNSVERYTVQPQLTTLTQPHTSTQPRQQDSVVEIQKSIEIYHSSPQHEIHYPGMLPTQVTQIDQQQQQQQQQQPQYFINNADENNKQLSQPRGDINYEITGTYSKVAGGNEPIYVVPPATYILDNNFVQKNNVQRDKTQQYQTNSQLIQLNKQQNDSYNNQKVPVPQPFAITVEIPVSQSYPVHVEKVAEKKIPIPVHIPIPRPYAVEKPIHIPMPIEKIVEKLVEKKVPYPVETPKYIEKSPSLQALHYGQQHYGVNYQQAMKPQNPEHYSHQLFSQHFQRYLYENPVIPPATVEANLEQNPFSKKHSYNSYLPPKSNSLIHRRHTAMQRPSDFLGPPPLQRQQQTFQPKKSFASRSTPSSLSRRARNHDPARHQKGNFRQSKIEYGFKPPMVPSIQYDEETASKVES